MKSVYACTKGDGVLALAIDIVAIQDPKVIGAFLKLAGESGLLIDRIDREDVKFEEPDFIKAAREAKDRNQIEIDFNKPAAGESGGPSSMPEGFTCTYSGGCPNEKQPCATCPYADNGIPKEIKEGLAVAAQEAAEPAPTLVDEIEGSPFMKWATNEAGEQIQVPAELLAEGDPMNDPAIDAKIEDAKTALEEWQEEHQGIEYDAEKEPDGEE